MRIFIAALLGAAATGLTWEFVSHNFLVCMIGPALVGLFLPLSRSTR